MLRVTAHSTGAAMGLYMNHEAWMLAQFMALPEETQEKWMAEKEANEMEGTQGNMLGLFQI